MAHKVFITGRKNVLITGGAGFIGSHLCDELVKENNVICLDDFTSSSERNIDHLLQLPNFEFINFDINEPIDLEKFPELKRFRIDVQGLQEIYHLACPTSPKNFEKTKIKTLKTNVIGTINMLELALRYKAKFLFTSSAVVYGPRRKENPYFKEDDFGQVNFLSPRACYDEGKRMAETCVMTYRQVYNLDTKILRIFRTYGPRMPLFDGHMVPDFVLQALNDKPLIIYGDESFDSSFCYISDIVEGIIKMMASDESGPFNLGHPEKYKMADLAKKIIQETHSKSEIIFRPPLLFMTPLGLPDITLAKEKLDWYPVVSLEEGLRRTIEDVKINRMLLQPLISKYDEDYQEE
ncbi:MAG: GDP-mannose 4,6-dehydratase [Patescibacteria group bacterium]|nr:GDP-mannose 4,6-dehydratase [Patescibacteria group bacterium]